MPNTTPATAELPEEQREARRTRARDLIEERLTETWPAWRRPGRKPNLPLAADIALDALGDLAAEVLVDGTMMRSLTIKDGVATLELAEATDMVRIFAAGMRGVLDGHGASNYVEMEMTDGATGQGYTVTVQRRDGTTAHQFRQQAEARVEELSAELAVARQLLGTGAGEAAPPAPLAEVWTVWREDEPIYAHYTTEDDARQGTIDCWQDDEPVCPDYSWRKDGPRLELVVGGEHAGVYASRHRVYGTPPAPADRAAILTEAAEVAAAHQSDCQNCAVELEVAAELRRLAGEAAAGVQPPCCGHPADWHDEWEGCVGPDGIGTASSGDCTCTCTRRPDQAAGVQQTAGCEVELTAAERQFLTFALDMAADEMSLADGFTDEDEAALAKFRALATPPAAPAVPEEPTP